MLFVGVLGYYSASTALEKLRIEELKSITDLKVEKIEDFFIDQKNHMRIAQRRPTIKKYCAILSGFDADFASPVYADIRDELDRALNMYPTVYEYANVLLANPRGRVVYALNRFADLDGINRLLPDLWQNAFTKGKTGIHLSAVFRSRSHDGQFSVYLTAPVHDINGVFVGVVALEVDMASIFQLVKDSTGMGETGETLIARKEGEGALYLNPLRHDENAALKRKVMFGQPRAIPIQEALKGNTGSGISTDYRGEKVVAVWQPMPALGWGIVAKIDASEAFAPATTLRNFVFLLVVAVTILSILLALLVARSLSDPIRVLQIGAAEIGRGNLDFRIETVSKDEIGELGRAFNRMTEELQAITASRDELNREMYERRKAEEALRLMEFSLNHSNEMLYWIDPVGNIVAVNDTTCSRLGYSRAEMVSLSISDIDSNLATEEYDQFWQDIKGNGSSKMQSYHHTKDDRRIPVEIDFNHIQFGDQEYICAIAHDISDRKRAEEELRKSMSELEERVKELNCLFEISRLVEKRKLTLDEIFRGIINLIPSAWRYPHITCARITLNEKELETANFKQSRWQQTSDIIVHAVIIGKIVVGYLEERPEHDEGPFLKEERALLDAIAERVGRIIERKWAQEALEESEKRFRDLVENSLTGISIIQNNQVVYQNQEQERLLGPLPRAYLLADLEKIHPDDVDKVRRSSQSINKAEIQTLETDFRFYPKNPKKNTRDLRWVHCRALLTEFRGKEALLVNMIDMTKAKELEHLLSIQDKMASLGRVAAGIAHEIRNPLSGINIYLNTLKKLRNRDGSEEKIEQIFGQIQSASYKIESVIRRVMDFAKPGEPKLASIDLNRPLTEAINLSAVTMRKAGIEIESRLSDNLPLCRADANQIEEMALNILNNAAEAMKTMEAGKRIVVTTNVEDQSIFLTFSDSGPGVAPEVKDKIFDPYFTTKPDGTGIGLSLTHRIVTDHGGSLSVADSDLGGAEFRIEIPIKE
jgi:PAS domain S-box-containing protein